MKIIRGKDITFVPVAHEDPKDPGVFKKILLKKEELSPGRIQMINWAKLLAGRAMNKHAHDAMEEVFIVIDGRVEITMDGKKDALGSGDAIVIPAGTVHEMKALGKKEVLYMVIGIV